MRLARKSPPSWAKNNDKTSLIISSLPINLCWVGVRKEPVATSWMHFLAVMRKWFLSCSLILISYLLVDLLRYGLCQQLWEIDWVKVSVSEPKLTFSEVKMFTQLYSNHGVKGFQKVHKPWEFQLPNTDVLKNCVRTPTSPTHKWLLEEMPSLENWQVIE